MILLATASNHYFACKQLPKANPCQCSHFGRDETARIQALAVAMGESGSNGKKKARSSSSESGTPDWLKKRREKQARGELKEDRGGMGDFAKGDKGDKGKGGGKEPRPGDWKCPSCGSNNFARRTECFKCGTKKPAEAGGPGGGKGRNRDSRSRSRGRR